MPVGEPARTLLLLRHAKSSWPPSCEDRVRPLAPRGERACLDLGRFLGRNRLLPDRVVVSPAVRTVETAKRVLAAAGSLAPVVEDERLYEPASGSITPVVAALPVEAITALIVGHEPELVELAEWLTGAALRLPTGCLVAIELGRPWALVRRGSGLVRLVLPPRVLDERASSATVALDT